MFTLSQRANHEIIDNRRLTDMLKTRWQMETFMNNI